jgi:hypothetical protein
MFIVSVRAGLIDYIELNTNKDILFRSNKYSVRIDCEVNSGPFSPIERWPIKN